LTYGLRATPCCRYWRLPAATRVFLRIYTTDVYCVNLQRYRCICYLRYTLRLRVTVVFYHRIGLRLPDCCRGSQLCLFDFVTRLTLPRLLLYRLQLTLLFWITIAPFAVYVVVLLPHVSATGSVAVRSRYVLTALPYVYSGTRFTRFVCCTAFTPACCHMFYVYRYLRLRVVVLPPPTVNLIAYAAFSVYHRYHTRSHYLPLRCRLRMPFDYYVRGCRSTTTLDFVRSPFVTPAPHHVRYRPLPLTFATVTFTADCVTVTVPLLRILPRLLRLPRIGLRLRVPFTGFLLQRPLYLYLRGFVHRSFCIFCPPYAAFVHTCCSLIRLFVAVLPAT